MFRSNLVLFGVVATAALFSSTPALAEDDGPVDIDVGTSRIGGPGTQTERKANAAYDAALEEEETPMTEESLPPKGDKKRIPALHKLVKQYWGGKMWKDICDKLDQIIEEGGEDALVNLTPDGKKTDPEGKKKAARAYFECGQIAFYKGDYDDVERLLKKSERFAPADSKHALIRHRMLREQYRKAMGNGDVANAMTLFKKYQAEQQDEDERIWMGEELAKLAWGAYQSKDKISMKEYVKYADEVAPMNTDLRRLKDKVQSEENVLPNAIKVVAVAVVLVFAGTQFSKWRARAKVRAVAGSAIDGADDEV